MALRITREFKIGFITIATILLFVWGLNYLKGVDVFSKQITFYAVYGDVSGLIVSNPVSVNGVKIGQVNRIRFMPDGSGRILVECIIDSQLQIPTNSVSELTGASLTGSREIVIEMGDAQEFVQSGDTLLSKERTSITQEVSGMLLPIQQKADDLFLQVDSVMMVFQAIFSQQTQQNITQSITSIQSTLENLENTTEKLDKTIESEAVRISHIFSNAESITHNLKSNNELLSNIIQNFSSISDSIAAANIKQTLADAEQSIAQLNQVMEKINTGEGSIGLLVNDPQLYHNMEASSKQLELLLEDIRKNPKNYINISVFGRN